MIVSALNSFLGKLNSQQSFSSSLLQGVLAELTSIVKMRRSVIHAYAIDVALMVFSCLWSNGRSLQDMSEVSHPWQPYHSFLPRPALRGAECHQVCQHTTTCHLSLTHFSHSHPRYKTSNPQNNRKQQHIVQSVKANLDHGDRMGLESSDVSSYDGSPIVKTWCSSSGKILFALSKAMC